jgi:phospholipid-translocating ATPase
MFGAAAPQVAMLPLVAILVITGVKDGIEDSRRHVLDLQVNNSPVTRLADWRNVNVPSEDTSFFAKLFRRSHPRSAKVSKGVRKLRQKEGDFSIDFLYDGEPQQSKSTFDRSSLSGDDDRPSELAYSIAPASINGDRLGALPSERRSRSNTLQSSLAHSTRSRSSGRMGVIDYNLPAGAMANWERTLWKKVEVGDIILLKENEQVPADMVVLSCSDADGTCFVETKNLDGETNLKPRKALRATSQIQSEEDVVHSRFVVDSEPPHANLYSYNGVLKYWLPEETPGQEHPIVEGRAERKKEERSEPITINELLLRGCALRNTKWVIGLVIFTGPDTKILLNSGQSTFSLVCEYICKLIIKP